MRRNKLIDVVLVLVFVSGCFLLSSGDVSGLGLCDNECRYAQTNIKLGAGGWCVHYESETCLWCMGLGMCLTSHPSHFGAVCRPPTPYTYNRIKDVLNCKTACTNITVGTTHSEASGTPTGEWRQAANYRWNCVDPGPELDPERVDED